MDEEIVVYIYNGILLSHKKDKLMPLVEKFCGKFSGKFWKRWEYPTTQPASWENCMQVRKQRLELYMEQQTGSK